MNRTELQLKVSNIVQHLPPLPQNIDQFFDTLRTAGSNKTKIIQSIKNDSSMCAEVLHIANSGCYAVVKPVETIEEAVEIVGINAILEDIGIRYANEAIKPDFVSLEHLDQYYIHGSEISIACSAIAEVAELSSHQRSMYAVAGQIHDIGRLVILLASNSLTAPLMSTDLESLFSIIQEEKAIIGMNHCEIGGQICSNWNFSDILCEGVFRHHTPVTENDFSMPGAVIFLAHFVSTSDFTGKILKRNEPLDQLARKIGLTPDGFTKAQQRYCKLSKKH